MKKFIRPALVALAVLGAGGWLWHQSTSGHRTGDGVLYGNVDIREVELAFRQSGRLEQVTVDEGDRVNAGDVLATIDSKPYADNLARAEAELQAARAELAKVRKGNRQQEIQRGEAQVAEARAALSLTQVEFQRQRDLKAKGVASQQALDTATTANARAEAGLQAAEQSLSLLREGFRSEDVAAAEARVAAATAARDQAQTALDDCRLVAPSPGLVLARVKEPGSLLAGPTTVLTLSLTDPVYVRAYVAETQLARVAPGTPVWVRSDSSATTYPGRVGFVSPRAEFTPKAVETTELRTDLVYRLRIVVEQSDGNLLQGMPVTVFLDKPQ